MNESQTRDPQSWRKWANNGAVDYTPRARQLGAAIFGYDPLIGCPFDDSEMEMVEASGTCRVGERYAFLGPNRLGTMEFPVVRGRIIAVGHNAKYLNGDRFTALAIQVGASIVFKSRSENWAQWKEDLLVSITKGDMPAAANMLVCSTIDRNGDWEEKDFRGYHEMFQHRLVLRHAKKLWKYMEPMLVPEFVDTIRNEMIDEGWPLD